MRRKSGKLINSRHAYHKNVAYAIATNLKNPLEESISFNDARNVVYGIVDDNQDYVYPSESNLKEFGSDIDVLALDFVVDAVEDFQKEVLSMVQSGRIPRSSFLSGIRISNGWESALELYNSHMAKVYSSFVGVYVARKENHTKIKNFNDFLESFLNFARRFSDVTPLTLSGFISSRHCTNRISGLVVELMDKSRMVNDVEYKMKIIRDPHFGLYKNLANKHGLKINFEVPWRLIADIRTSKTRFYMDRPPVDNNGNATKPGQRYGIKDIPTLFQTYYYKAHKQDIRVLKKYLVAFYNTFAENFAFSKIVCAGGTTRDAKTKSTFFSRELVEESKVDSLFSNGYWSVFYFKIRMYEREIKISRLDQKNIFDRIMRLNKNASIVGFDQGVRFMNNKIFELSSLST
jgi:hypothetical protein